jgi:uncharacterized protein YkwD
LRERGGNALALIVVLALAMAFFRLGPLEVSAEPLHDEEVTGCDGRVMHLSGIEAELRCLHNEAGTERGISPLCVREQLMAAATAHSEDMLERGYYAHDTPEGTEPADRARAARYAYRLMAENIHMRTTSYGGDPDAKDLEEVFEDWMASEGHRENILNPALYEVGIGVASGDYRTELGTTSLYTVDFATPK